MTQFWSQTHCIKKMKLANIFRSEYLFKEAEIFFFLPTNKDFRERTMIEKHGKLKMLLYTWSLNKLILYERGKSIGYTRRRNLMHMCNFWSVARWVSDVFCLTFVAFIQFVQQVCIESILCGKYIPKFWGDIIKQIRK